MSTFTVAPASLAQQRPGGLSAQAAGTVSPALNYAYSNGVDSYSPSAAATALLASTATPANATRTGRAAAAEESLPDTDEQTNPSDLAVQEFEQGQAPPPYTLRDFRPNPGRDNARLLTPSPSAFQARQFSAFFKTLQSLSSPARANFSFSA